MYLVSESLSTFTVCFSVLSEVVGSSYATGPNRLSPATCWHGSTPPWRLHILPGDAETGEALVLDRNVNMISFTGSTAVGRRVGELAGRGLKRVSLELGGNNAYIVLDDADVEKAVAAGAFGSYFFQGQICFTAGRHLVHERVADRYIELLKARTRDLRVGDPFRDQVDLGPMLNERQAARVERIVQESVAAGAIL